MDEISSTARSAWESTAPVCELFRRASSFVPSAVAILSTPGVLMTVSSLQCVSFDPPWISVSLAKDSSKGRGIREARRFRARFLRTNEEAFTKAEAVPASAGLVELECRIASSRPVGDHYLVLAEVREVSIGDGYPLLYWGRALHRFRPRYVFLETRRRFDEFVTAWEIGTLPKAEWTHAAHVAVGAYYVVRFRGAAFEQMKKGIVRHNSAVGTPNTDSTGYHETLTRLWADILARVAADFTDPWLAACYAVEKLGENRDLHQLYYSFDVVRSAEARRSWVAPDMRGPYKRSSGRGRGIPDADDPSRLSPGSV